MSDKKQKNPGRFSNLDISRETDLHPHILKEEWEELLIHRHLSKITAAMYKQYSLIQQIRTRY